MFSREYVFAVLLPRSCIIIWLGTAALICTAQFQHMLNIPNLFFSETGTLYFLLFWFVLEFFDPVGVVNLTGRLSRVAPILLLFLTWVVAYLFDEDNYFRTSTLCSMHAYVFSSSLVLLYGQVKNRPPILYLSPRQISRLYFSSLAVGFALANRAISLGVPNVFHI